MSVLRRLVNVAYGKVRVWQRGDPFDGIADVDPAPIGAAAPSASWGDPTLSAQTAPSTASTAAAEAPAPEADGAVRARVRRL